MTVPEQSDTRRRDYKALREHCPECNAEEGRPCLDRKGRPMRGVHRRRNLLYNDLEAAELAAAMDAGRSL